MPYYPKNAFILAAGMGSRLRPYTDKMPKPMVEIAGRSLINRSLDLLEAAEVENVTVNLHYKAELLQNHLTKRQSPKITFSREDKLLDTGGGVKKALSNMQGKPFFLLSGDTLWNDAQTPALKELSHFWDEEKMDMLLLVYPVNKMKLTKGVGDYDLYQDGRLKRSKDQSGKYMFTSIRLVSPRLFDSTPDTAFSFLDLMDKAQNSGRLYGLVHDGEWYHISTASDLENVNRYYLTTKKRSA
jgi:MurNAc alpha-1-phosphate uridylyltransferase